MNVECWLTENRVLNIPICVVKIENRLFVKTAKNQEGVNGLIDYCLKLSSNFKNLLIKLSIKLEKDLVDKLRKVSNISFTERVSADLIEHTNKALENDPFCKESEIEINYFKMEGLKFLVINRKTILKASIHVRCQREDESLTMLLKRFVSKYNNAKIIYSGSDIVLKKMSEMKILGGVRKEYRDFDVNDFFNKNQESFNNHIKSHHANKNLKSKYEYDDEATKNKGDSLIVYTDGSILPTGESGVGVVITKNDKTVFQFGKKVSDMGSSDKCECQGVRVAVQFLIENRQLYLTNDIKHIEFRTDSLGTVKRVEEIREGKKVDSKAESRDLQALALSKEMLSVSEEIEISLRWNKGHAGLYFNEMADAIAKMATSKESEELFVPNLRLLEIHNEFL